jgi:signal transduction histidine kinase
LGQLEKTLATKCDEVVTLLSSPTARLALSEFLWIETNYRSSPYAYFYQITDPQGGIVAQSDNLRDRKLPLSDPAGIGGAASFRTIRLGDPSRGEPIRLRSERVAIPRTGGKTEALLVQTAVSLVPFDIVMRSHLLDALTIAALSLLCVFVLLWLVTTRALRPVSIMTRMASRISATHARDRLPFSGRRDELDQLSAVLNAMLDRLEGSMRQMEQFSSDAAHQLRTPLTRIRGEVDLILGGGLPDPPRGQLVAIQEEIERLSRLCSRLLLLARLDQRAADATPFEERVDLAAVVEEIIEHMAPVADQQRVSLLRGAVSPAVCRGSRPLLVEALLNLMDNAIRHTPGGGRVEVSLERRDGEARLLVRDEGPGVPIEEQDKIFQRFYRIAHGTAPRADGSDEGSGLGLAVVRGIALAHRGRVELRSAPGEGSVFSLILPVLPGAVA